MRKGLSSGKLLFSCVSFVIVALTLYEISDKVKKKMLCLLDKALQPPCICTPPTFSTSRVLDFSSKSHFIAKMTCLK